MDRCRRIDRVLTQTFRYLQYGAIAGMIGFGIIGWVWSLGTAIVVAGVVMIALGGFVALGFTEHNFTPRREHRWRASVSTFRRGAALARRDQDILLVFSATLLVSGGAEAYDRLYPKRLIDLGFPEEPDPILWFTALGIVLLLVGALALRVVEHRIDGVGVPRRVLLASCVIGATGMLLLGHAPNAAVGIAGTILVGGVAWEVIRSVSVIWVNRRTTSDVRATVQSFLGQTESLGEICGGVVMALVARATSITVALTLSAALLTTAALVVGRSRAGRAPTTDHGAEHAPGRVA